jgi:hypothetical protein
MACIPDTVTPKGVIINLNSGSDYTNCTVYTGLTDSVITGTTNCVNVTGTTCSLTGLSATLMEVFVKIDCEGCCSNIFRVNLDECCGYEEVLTPTPTPTYSQTITPTYSQTPTPTFTPSACECDTYRITFNSDCSEFINWTDCTTNTSMFEQGDYFGLPSLKFTTGTVLDICSCSLPTTDCTLVTISLVTSGCTLEGGFSITTPTPTPTETPSIPSLTAVLQTSYSLNDGATFTNFSDDAPISLDAEGVLCDILNAAPDGALSGFSFRYYTNPIGVGTQIFGFMSPYNPIPDMIGLYSTGIILSGAPTYYVKTDNDGYITEFTLLTTCDSKVWDMTVCDNYCFGGTAQCVSSTQLNLYTDLTVTDITANGVVIYTDAERTLPFNGFFTIISNGKIYDVSSGIIGAEYTINGPC